MVALKWCCKEMTSRKRDGDARFEEVLQER